jgi:hypothetical protein
MEVSMKFDLCTAALDGTCGRQAVEYTSLDQAINRAGRLLSSGAIVAWVENELGQVVATMAMIKNALAAAAKLAPTSVAGALGVPMSNVAFHPRAIS